MLIFRQLLLATAELVLMTFAVGLVLEGRVVVTSTCIVLVGGGPKSSNGGDEGVFLYFGIVLTVVAAADVGAATDVAFEIFGLTL